MDSEQSPKTLITPTNNKTLRPAPKFDNKDLTKSSFWISQVFMMVATIVGVFLAAQQGLSQAIMFDTLNSKESNFYLRYSLDNEITNNIVILKEYAIQVEKKKTYGLKADRPVLLDFVWENMKYSPATLETPSHILSKANQFYLTTDKIITNITNRKYGVKFGVGKLRELIKEMEETGLKSLRENHQRLARELAESDIIVVTK